LKSKADFLIHRVVLQFLLFPVFRAMFHVKHFCVRGLSSQPGRSTRPRDVSRETFLRKSAARH